jgi:hypothetical protein
VERFDSLPSLYEALPRLEGTEWVYTNKQNWNREPQKAEFFVIPEREVDALPDEAVYESEHGPFLPRSLGDKDLIPWMPVNGRREPVSEASTAMR